MHRLDERGVVSMLTAVFFSILVMIVTLSTLAVQTRELRQSTDADQSVRAYYAAETGLELGLLKLKSDPKFRTAQDCQDRDFANPKIADDTELVITCLRIVPNTVSGSGTLAQEVATQYDLSDQGSLSKIVLNWNQGDPSSFAGNEDFPPQSSPNVLPAKGHWGIPAVMELTVYSYPKTNILPSEIQARTVLLRPSTSGGTVDLDDVSKIHPADCNNRSTYNCHVEITNLPKKTSDGRTLVHVVRFRPRYNGTAYDITFINDNNESVTASSGGVKIDVTARAGSIFRRLVATSGGGGVPLSEGLDYVIFTQKDICKDISVNTGTGKVTGRLGTGSTCHEEEDETLDDGGEGPGE